MRDKKAEELYNKSLNEYHKENYLKALDTIEIAINIDAYYSTRPLYRNLLKLVPNYHELVAERKKAEREKAEKKKIEREKIEKEKKKKSLELKLQKERDKLSEKERKTELHFSSGNEYLAQTNYEKAKLEYEKAIEINPNFAKAYNILGTVFKNGFSNYEKAKINFKKAIEIDPSYSYAYLNLGNILANELKDKKSAKPYFEKYQELTKTNPEEYTKENSTAIESLDYISIKNYYSIHDIEIKNLKDKKEIYILGENGDGKTIFLQALFLAFQQSYLKTHGEASLIGEALDAISNNPELLLSGKDESGGTYNFMNTKYANNIFAYGVNRNRINGTEDKYGFMSLFNNQTKLNNPTSWFIDLFNYENAKDTSLIPLKNGIDLFKEILGKDVEIVINHKSAKFIEKGTELEFEQLSDGYRSILIWVSDLITKLSSTQTDAKSSKDFKGVVIVDEVALHLHPRWSNTIVGKLRAWFPKIQWIFTTHSPEVVLGADKDAVFYKLCKEDGKVKIYQPFENLEMTSNSLLTSLLWNLGSFKTKGFPAKKVSSDDYLTQKIHNKVSKYIKDVPNLTDDDITKMVEEELTKLGR